MSKHLRVLIFWLCLFGATSASAQEADTTKRPDVKGDTVKPDVKIDTALLNKYRLGPRKNAIPVRMRSVQIQPTYLPITMLDYKVNYWKKWITVQIDLSQAAFSNNFSNGGVSSMAVNSKFIYRTEYRKNTFSYTGNFEFWYGVTKNKGQGSRKSNDRIFLDNKFATQFSKSWSFFGSLTFESQFDRGYQYTGANNVSLPTPILLSRFMSPGYLTESFGFEYKPVPYFTTRFGTGTARQTFVLDTAIYRTKAGNYGVPVGKRVKNDLAFQIVSEFNKGIATNMGLRWRYALFIPYEKHISFITHRLDVGLSAQVNKLISANINGVVVYDKNQSKEVQASENISLGMVYRFP